MDMFFRSLNFMDYIWCFIVGGIICVIAQILIDKTKITPARILVLFVTVRCYFAAALDYMTTLLSLQELVRLFQLLVLVQTLQKVP